MNIRMVWRSLLALRNNAGGFSRGCRVALLVVCGVLAPTLNVYASDIVVGSWNIQRLGHGNHKSYPALAAIASKVDLLAVQEVMTEEGAALLEKKLEKHTGEPWSRLVSHAIGSRNYKEMYAFFWRESAVEYSEGAVVYLDRRNDFIREPFSAKFRSKRDGSEFALGTVHILYGKSIQDRTPEIKALEEYWLWLGEVYPDTPLVLVGDFNLDQSHGAWSPLKRHAKALLTSGATTLSQKPGRYANLYDNIWVERNTKLAISDAGIIDFPRMIGWSHKKSRKHVSDHAPVYMALGSARLAKGAIKAVPTPRASKPPVTAQREPRATESHQGIRGNANSMVYHRPDCPSYSRVSERNRVPFNSADAAKAAGYREAGNCP